MLWPWHDNIGQMHQDNEFGDNVSKCLYTRVYVPGIQLRNTKQRVQTTTGMFLHLVIVTDKNKMDNEKSNYRGARLTPHRMFVIL